MKATMITTSWILMNIKLLNKISKFKFNKPKKSLKIKKSQS